MTETTNGDARLASLSRVTPARVVIWARWGRTLRLIWNSSPFLTVAGLALVFIQSALPLLLLYLMKLIFDAFAAAALGPIGAVPIRGISYLVLLAGAVAVAQSLIGAAARIVTTLQAEAVKSDVHDLIELKSTEIDLGFYEDQRYRNSLYRAQQYAPHRPVHIVTKIHDVLRNAATLIGMAGLLASFHWAILPVLCLAALPGVILRMRNAPRHYDWQRRFTALERRSLYLSQVLTTPRYAEELRLYDLGGHFRLQVRNVRSKLRVAARRVTIERSLADGLAEALAVCGMFGVFLAIGLQALNGQFSLGTLVMSFQALQRAWTHLGILLHSLADLHENDLFLAELFEFLDLKPTISDTPLSVAAPLHGIVCADGRCSRPPPASP